MEWLVMQYHDGQLPERHRTAVEAHLAACASCRGYGRATRSAGVWLQGASTAAARAVEFPAVWTAVAARLKAPAGIRIWGRIWGRPRVRRLVWRRPLQLNWLAAGSLAAALLLLLINPFSHLPSPPSHEAYVAFVEVGDYPVMVFTPSTPGDMTVIWLFEPRDDESNHPT
jgi:anti-sigma factor RsiW